VGVNVFFASVEQRDFPELRGKPVGVTNGEVGTTLIACSYEARAAGAKTGRAMANSPSPRDLARARPDAERHCAGVAAAGSPAAPTGLNDRPNPRYFLLAPAFADVHLIVLNR